MEMCLLEPEKVCTMCGKCDMCEYEHKLCDNCFSCLDFNVDYNEIIIDRIIMDGEGAEGNQQ